MTTAHRFTDGEPLAENDARRYLGFGDSPVGVTTPLGGGPQYAARWREYDRRHLEAVAPRKQRPADFYM
jgi:hypothetical protein